MNVDKRAFKLVLREIENGWIFEDFAQKFLNARLGKEFIPVGGSKDKGIDGFQHVFSSKSDEKDIYQISTELSDPLKKIEDTIAKLKKNKKPFSRLIYVTNREVRDKDDIIEVIYTDYEIFSVIYDNAWFEKNVNYNESTLRVHESLIKENFQNLSIPGKSYAVANLDQDSRLYVFLRQQFENNDSEPVNDVLVDTLILFALEETDPDLDKVESPTSIISKIKGYIKKDDALISEIVNKRLEILSKSRTNRIQNNKQLGGYCLPYETRLKIQERNVTDKDLHASFINQTCNRVTTYLKESEVKVRDVTSLVENILQEIFYQQGLEFSNFLLNGNSEQSIEKELIQVINSVLEKSSVVPQNRGKVKECLVYVIRDIVYNGSEEQKYFLKSLSNTYMLIFLLKWDSKISTFFYSLSNKLQVFVGNSIIIPAFSEKFLDSPNRRHWNLLKAARSAGIKLLVTDYIVDELAGHFKMVIDKYNGVVNELEDFYLEDESNLVFIEEIMLRAYFYSKKRGKITNFDAFINNFVDPDLKSLKNDLIEVLNEEFGIEYLSPESIDVKIDQDTYQKLYDALKIEKSSTKKAAFDSKLILTIYALREKNNESNDTGIFGYRTWWLSKDTSTFKVVKKVLEKDYYISCYMRTDFLYNYIALTPRRDEVKAKYDELFPSLLGVNLSYHMSSEVALAVQKTLIDHKELPMARKKSAIRKLTEKLKTDSTLGKKRGLSSFFESEFK